jgi:hypothetical protein
MQDYKQIRFGHKVRITLIICKNKGYMFANCIFFDDICNPLFILEYINR